MLQSLSGVNSAQVTGRKPTHQEVESIQLASMNRYHKNESSSESQVSYQVDELQEIANEARYGSEVPMSSDSSRVVSFRSDRHQPNESRGVLTNSDEEPAATQPVDAGSRSQSSSFVSSSSASSEVRLGDDLSGLSSVSDIPAGVPVQHVPRRVLDETALGIAMVRPSLDLYASAYAGQPSHRLNNSAGTDIFGPSNYGVSQSPRLNPAHRLSVASSVLSSGIRKHAGRSKGKQNFQVVMVTGKELNEAQPGQYQMCGITGCENIANFKCSVPNDLGGCHRKICVQHKSKTITRSQEKYSTVVCVDCSLKVEKTRWKYCCSFFIGGIFVSTIMVSVIVFVIAVDQ